MGETKVHHAYDVLAGESAKKCNVGICKPTYVAAESPSYPDGGVPYDFDYYNLMSWEINSLRLCPPRHDFTVACRCLECCNKMKELKDFERDINFKMNQVWNYEDQWDATVDQCVDLCTPVAWTKLLLDFFHKNLQALYKAIGVSPTLERSDFATEVEAIELRMAKILVDYGLLNSYPPSEPLEECNIKDGLYFYEKSISKFKDEAGYLLKMIEEIEKEHEAAKKSADAENEQLAHSSSIAFIEEQIKLVEKLPVKKLLLEAEELISKVIPISYYSDMFANARECITDTSCAMVKERCEFWRQHDASPPESRAEDHNLNGLGDTFKSLFDKVKSFKNEWEKYAIFLSLNKRFDPDQKATE